MNNAWGYHGTSTEIADKLASGVEGFTVTRNEGDWLGPGVYFWQDAPARALFWAKRKFKDAAVVRAQINLTACLDLLELTDFLELKLVQDRFEEFERDSGVVYQQDPLKLLDGVMRIRSGRKKPFVNDRDQAFLEFAIPLIEQSRGSKIKCIRAAFVYGRALNATSFLFDWAHVQICVFGDYASKLISRVTKLELEGDQ